MRSFVFLASGVVGEIIGPHICEACSEVCEIDALVPPVVGYSEETLPEFMKSSGIDVCRFGSGGVKSLVEFSEELLRGESALVKQKDGTLSRVVDVVILLLTEPSGNIGYGLGSSIGGLRSTRTRVGREGSDSRRLSSRLCGPAPAASPDHDAFRTSSENTPSCGVQP